MTYILNSIYGSKYTIDITPPVVNMASNYKEKVYSQMNKINLTVEELENNLQQSRNIERKAHLCFHVDNLKSKAVSVQLDDAKQDNKHLLKILQSGHYEDNSTRGSELGTSMSTMSMVNLQYKYEELLSTHNGLLKMLEEKLTEIHNVTEDKSKLIEELEVYKFKLEEASEKIEDLNVKMKSYQLNHAHKLEKLKLEKDTLKTVHNQLVSLLHEECMKKNEILSEKLRETQIPERAQFLKEVQKNNLLIFDNIQLRQENEYYRALLKMSMSKSKKKRKRRQQMTLDE